MFLTPHNKNQFTFKLLFVKAKNGPESTSGPLIKSKQKFILKSNATAFVSKPYKSKTRRRKTASPKMAVFESQKSNQPPTNTQPTPSA